MNPMVKNQTIQVIVENRTARVLFLGIQGPPGIQGQMGPAGPQGPQGVQGPPGPAGEISGTLPWERVTTDETTLDDELTPFTDYVIWFENQLT